MYQKITTKEGVMLKRKLSTVQQDVYDFEVQKASLKKFYEDITTMAQAITFYSEQNNLNEAEKWKKHLKLCEEKANTLKAICSDNQKILKENKVDPEKHKKVQKEARNQPSILCYTTVYFQNGENKGSQNTPAPLTTKQTL